MAALRSLSLGLLLLTGCAGATASDLFAPVTEAPSATEPEGDRPADEGSSGGTGTPTGEPGGGGSESTSSGSPLPPDPTADAGTDDASTPLPSSCATESEPNDSLLGADPFDRCIRGGLPAADDDDFAKTTAPPGAVKKLVIKTEQSGGKVSYRLFVNGAPVMSFTDDPPESLPTIPGATYAFRMQPAGDAPGPRAWKLEVAFE